MTAGCGVRFIAEAVPWIGVPGGPVSCNMDAGHPGDHRRVRDDGLVLRQAHPLLGWACACGITFDKSVAVEAFLHENTPGGRVKKGHKLVEVRGDGLA